MDFELANALARIVELKDQSTGAHTWRVTMYAQAVAEAERMPISTVMGFMLGAVLHDSGKIDIPAEILSKPGRLTDAEYETMKSHTVLGWERVQRMGVRDPLVLHVIRSHHERIDGTGYPDGLVGEAIPIAARWFSVIDGFDAMTSLRPYRDGVGEDAAVRAIADLREHAGTWYEPRAVEVFDELHQTGRLDSILEHLNDREGHASLVGPLDSEAMSLARNALLESTTDAEDVKRIEAILDLGSERTR